MKPIVSTEDFEFNEPARRVATEHPEEAYRRGYQQGANTVREALVAADVLDPSILRKLNRFVDITIGQWRYCSRRRKREIVRDRAPEVRL